MTLPSAVSSVSPRTETICPACNQPSRRSASGGGSRSSVPSSSRAPFTSPRLPCRVETILPLTACSDVARAGPFGGPLSTTLLPVAILVIDAASISGSARARKPLIETASPGWIANTICAVRCGGSLTSMPSLKISPSTSPRGVSVYCFTVPRVSGSCDESHTPPAVCA